MTECEVDTWQLRPPLVARGDSNGDFRLLCVPRRRTAQMFVPTCSWRSS